jgi:hypothetical protein
MLDEEQAHAGRGHDLRLRRVLDLGKLLATGAAYLYAVLRSSPSMGAAYATGLRCPSAMRCRARRFTLRMS